MMALLKLFKKTFPEQYQEFIKVSSNIIPLTIKEFIHERKQRVTPMKELVPKTVDVLSEIEPTYLAEVFLEILLND